ncbi:MAG: HAMP domain-containing histidine kinase [Bacteroidales bacterium]|nr:HAMP domain-containing histidine kinase [Bacteroidales bacterium]MDD2570455.1 HAMP domain-containing sensor histidine kinase [Bacteroidales bacterium]MDD2813216.1 HAMP domain-containing sensor histidine kinase [Bacteroidales bacterium]MDD3384231.1 HAMP domain-containing sensor histidine kinase [Bacteroidales bacterium]MDD3811021.1 HAMP domain-containing sensor histidine kinase [Bacteroidales bacterium]
MHIYTRKQRWKFYLLAGALVIGVLSSWYSNVLVRKLEKEEKLKMEIWAGATEQMTNSSVEQDDKIMGFLISIIQNNTTIPVITVDEKGERLIARNIKLYDAQNQPIDGSDLRSLNRKSKDLLNRMLVKMKSQHEPITIELGDTQQFIYYKDSYILTRIQLYPLIQLAVVFLFIVLAYFAFSSTRKAEQNQVWVGMSKETAHQLGTPISSLMAWVELLKMEQTGPEVVQEVSKDVKRLETIADRFSKIGSAPVLLPENLPGVLVSAVNYLQTRTSDKVVFNLHFGDMDELLVPLNVTLFEWVVENLCKNAIDAMDGSGQIDITLRDQNQVVYLDITDNGKGMPKSNYQVVFQPGYTTKPRGWGLGLSLVKRIIENYHNGKIFVRSSEINKGTTFRIVLKK